MAKCTGCGALERDRVLALFIIDKIHDVNAQFYFIEERAARSRLVRQLIDGDSAFAVDELGGVREDGGSSVYVYCGHSWDHSTVGNWQERLDQLAALPAGTEILLTPGPAGIAAAKLQDNAPGGLLNIIEMDGRWNVSRFEIPEGLEPSAIRQFGLTERDFVDLTSNSVISLRKKT